MRTASRDTPCDGPVLKRGRIFARSVGNIAKARLAVNENEGPGSEGGCGHLSLPYLSSKIRFMVSVQAIEIRI